MEIVTYLYKNIPTIETLKFNIFIRETNYQFSVN